MISGVVLPIECGFSILLISSTEQQHEGCDRTSKRLSAKCVTMKPGVLQRSKQESTSSKSRVRLHNDCQRIWSYCNLNPCEDAAVGRKGTGNQCVAGNVDKFLPSGCN
eukprot:1823775-Amphidinium_carterae.1